MAIYGITDGTGGVWAFDPDMIYAIVRAAVRTRLIRRRSSAVTHSAGFFLPTTYNLETNWNGFRSEMESEARRYWAEAEMQLRLNPNLFFGTLVGLLNDAIADNNWFRTVMATCAQQSSQSIERVVGNWQTVTDITRLIRDGAATVLVVTAGIVAAPAGAAAAGAAGMTGISVGTATTTLAVGSVMRGAFTYQDTGNVGSATINAAGSFTVGMIGIGAAGATLSTGGQATILVIGSGASAVTAGGQALVEGNTVQQAAVAAVVAAGSQALGGVVGSRIENLSFFAQLSMGTIIDLTGSRVSSAAVNAMGSSNPTPATRGSIDFLGIPASAAEAFIRRNVMCPVRG